MNLYLWDADGMPQQSECPLILWRSYSNSEYPNAVSIPKLVEEKSDILRSRYLAWVYDLGEMPINDQRLVDHLEIRPGFSYWWIAPIAEKCNWAKSHHITDVIRLMALDDWAAGKNVEKIILVSNNKSLSKCISSWVSGKNLVFEWRKVNSKSSGLSLIKRFSRRSPHLLKGAVWLTRYLLLRWSLKDTGLSKWRMASGDVTFISYLFNLVPSALNEGRYESRFWGRLPDDLKDQGISVNWLHLYVKDTVVPDVKSAKNAVKRLNGNAEGKQVHATLDSFLNAGIVIKTLQDWLTLFLKWPTVGKALSKIPLAGCDVSIMYQRECKSAFLGVTAVANCLYYNLMRAAMAELPEQRIGFYLQENQPWELALLHAWRAAGHGKIVGVLHSTVRYWDLRYYYDPRTFTAKNRKALPFPDMIAVNGPVAMSAFLDSGYPQQWLCELEALRYLHLYRQPTEITDDSARNESGRSLKILVLGDYLEHDTRYQLSLLESAFAMLPKGVEIIVKPHPNCPVDEEDYPSMKFRVSYQPIVELLPECDIAYTSMMTSAAVDAYCAGLTVISILDPDTLNLSPLKGTEDVGFVSSAKELANMLQQAFDEPPCRSHHDDFFTIDLQLPRWREMIAQS
jgi:surface carbohydrate biosynthesis protein (TIGR04326 family)